MAHTIAELPQTLSPLRPAHIRWLLCAELDAHACSCLLQTSWGRHNMQGSSGFAR